MQTEKPLIHQALQTRDDRCWQEILQQKNVPSGITHRDTVYLVWQEGCNHLKVLGVQCIPTTTWREGTRIRMNDTHGKAVLRQALM